MPCCETERRFDSTDLTLRARDRTRRRAPGCGAREVGSRVAFQTNEKMQGVPKLNATPDTPTVPDTLAPDDCKRWQVFSCRVHKNIITFYACYEMIDASSPGIARWTRELDCYRISTSFDLEYPLSRA
jgi:hypothetical protein